MMRRIGIGHIMGKKFSPSELRINDAGIARNTEIDSATNPVIEYFELSKRASQMESVMFSLTNRN
jgi:hypothetical protein